MTRTLLGAAVPVSLGRGAVFRTGADSVISTPGRSSALVILTAASPHSTGTLGRAPGSIGAAAVRSLAIDIAVVMATDEVTRALGVLFTISLSFSTRTLGSAAVPVFVGEGAVGAVNYNNNINNAVEADIEHGDSNNYVN